MHRSETISALLDSFEITGRLMQRYFHASLESEMTGSHVRLLHMLGSKQPLKSSMLAEKLFLTPGAVSQLVEPLVSAGYIKRTPDPADRRSIGLSLTNEGTAKLQEVQKIRRTLLEDLFSKLDTAELETFLIIQQKLADSLAKTNPLNTKDIKAKETA